MRRRVPAVPALLTAAVLAWTAALSPTRAEPPVCAGTDLRDGSDADRRLLAEADAKAAAVRNAEGVFWRVEPPGGGAPSHLLGTLHVTDPTVTNLTPVRRTAFEGSKVVAVENRAMIDIAMGGAERARNLDRMIFTDGHRLTDFLDETDRAALRKALAARGLPLWSVVGFRPWMIIFGLLQYVPCETERLRAGIHLLDQRLLDEAAAAGRPTADLEDLDVELGRIDGIPFDLQLRLLRKALADEPRVVDQLATVIRLYHEGRAATLLHLLIYPSQDPEIGEAETIELKTRLLDLRNGDMFEHARPLVDAGGAFLAVGAGHLIGDTGLVARFQDAGYTVTRPD